MGKLELLMFRPVMELAVMLKALLLVSTVAPFMLSAILVAQVRPAPRRKRFVALHGSVHWQIHLHVVACGQIDQLTTIAVTAIASIYSVRSHSVRRAAGASCRLASVHQEKRVVVP